MVELYVEELSDVEVARTMEGLLNRMGVYYDYCGTSMLQVKKDDIDKIVKELRQAGIACDPVM